MKIEALLQMGSGYVLDFSNRTFFEFILTSTGKDINDKKYDYGSGSKANRLRAFWNTESDKVVGKLLSEMLERWKTQKVLSGQSIQQNEQAIFDECQGVAGRLLGTRVSSSTVSFSEDEFINLNFRGLSLSNIDLDSDITGVLEQRLGEIRKCLSAKSSLATIFLCGSTLEGILLGTALKRPRDFNASAASPKDRNGQVLKFQDWTLSNFIDVAYSLSLLGEDVKKFSHALRDFRNYIHPYQQMASRFNPDEHTAKICWQVLQAAISQLSIANKKI